MPEDPTPVLGLNRFLPHEGGIAGLLNENMDVLDDFAAGGGVAGGLPWTDVTAPSVGAVGNGTADDTAAIQGAFGNNKIVFFPYHTYKVTDQGSGFCLNISSYSGLRLLGPTSGRGNPSGTGGGATIFTSSASTVIVKAAPGTLNHYGPQMENLRVEDRSGSSDCIHLTNFNNYTFNSVTCHGIGGSTTAKGWVLEATDDASYGTFINCNVQHLLVGLSAHTSVGFAWYGGYAHSATTNAILFDLQGGTAFAAFYGVKCEMNHVSGAIAFKVTTVAAVQISANFEGCTTGVYLTDLGSLTNSLTSIALCSFEGSDGSETGVYVGTNRRNVQIGFCSWSNLAHSVTDNGTDTIIMGTPTTGSLAGQRILLGGVYVGSGTAAPTAAAVDGSFYLRSGVGVYHRSGGAWNLIAAGTFATWARLAATYSASITPDGTGKSLISITVTDGTAFTINFPTGLVDGQIVAFSIYNNSGGTIGNVTWGTGFATTWSNASHKPANTHRSTVLFVNINGSFYQCGLSADLI